MSATLVTPRKKYSARSLAAGAVFCPACRKKLEDRGIQKCPACGFAGEHTMWLFPLDPPPLETISDHAELFSPRDLALVRKSIELLRKQFPQIHWKVVTASLREDEDAGLFSFWLLNVSPPGGQEMPGCRAWTVLFVIFADGQTAIVPGYSAEIWLSGHDWGRLLKGFMVVVKRKGYGIAVRNFMREAGRALDKSWMKARRAVRKKHQRALRPIS